MLYKYTKVDESLRQYLRVKELLEDEIKLRRYASASKNCEIQDRLLKLAKRLAFIRSRQ